MRRRTLLATGLSTAIAAALPRASLARTPGEMLLAEDHPLQPAWQAWKALCLAPEGRVIDGFQGGASHSEGQGYGLTLAAIFGDRPAVEAIIAWTERHLAIRPDGLLAWRWLPEADPPVPDRNTASDGDLFYAWGLALAARRDGRGDLVERATTITRALIAHETAEHPDGSGRRLLLPGVSGFRSEAGLIINPSYYMPLAMRQLAEWTGVAELARIAAAGDALIAELAGSRALVPDWILVTPQGFRPAPERFSAASGSEALRVALFQIWSGQGDSPATRGFASASAAAGFSGGDAPVVFDSQTGTVRERSSHPGYAALAALSGCVARSEVGAPIPAFTREQPYYPATLHLMALVAQAVAYPRCVPI